MCVFSAHGADIEFSWCHKCERYEYIHFFFSRQSEPVTRLVKIANHINHYPYWTHCWTKKKIVGEFFLCVKWTRAVVMDSIIFSLATIKTLLTWSRPRTGLNSYGNPQFFFSLHTLLQGLSCYGLLYQTSLYTLIYNSCWITI